MALVRAVATEPLLMRFSASSDEATQEASGEAAGVSVVIGICTSAVIGGVSAFLHSSLGTTMGALAVILPFLLLQDAWRFAFFAARRPSQAALNDAIFGVAQVTAVVLVVSGNRTSPSAVVLAWGAAAAVAAGAGFFQSKIRPRVGSALSWLWHHRDISPKLLGDAGAMYGSRQGVIYIIGALAGLHGLGQYRAAEAILGPANVLLLAAMLIGVPEGARAYAARPARFRLHTAVMALALGLAVALWGLTVASLPQSWGTLILGPAWESAGSVIIPLTLATAASGVSTGFNIGLRVIGAATEMLRARLALAAGVLAGGSLGAVMGHARGAAIGIAVASCVGASLYYRAFAQALMRREDQPTQAPGEPPGAMAVND